MSASSKKKLRNAEQAEKLTEKQLAEQKEAKKLKLYTTLAVVILAALVLFATDLDLVLRQHKIENVIIVGTKTNCCIRATVTDAFYLDYNGIVISDCVATNSEEVNRVHLEDIRKYLGQVMDSETLFAKLESGEL